MSAAPGSTRVAGGERIRAAFATAGAQGRAALVPYVVCGRPSLDAVPALVSSLVEAGADVVELGVPFSDPLADGPTIRDATRLALDDGVTVAGCLAAVRAVRAAGVEVPIVLMGYVNPLLAYGIDAFCRDAADAGVDGLIVPDAAALVELHEAAGRHGLGMTMLATPLTDGARLGELAAGSTGFLYVVAATGTTGARSEVASSTVDLLARVRRELADGGDDVPVAVGFGISTPEHVAALAGHADGVIVGSALVALLERDPEAVPGAVAELRRATVRDR
ncbi:MAG: tryptophan synthase, alpha subunit [Thermoleophilia bacterium]|nr:tryptophan synthase, alpha subunit [Thermoleophilia bacterium]